MWVTTIAVGLSLSLVPSKQAPPKESSEPEAVDLLNTQAPEQPRLLGPKDERWKHDHLRVMAPVSEGKGLWIAGIAAISGIFIKQAVLIYTCGDPGCRSGRLSDRLLWLGATATLGYASSLRAHHVAYHDALRQTLAPPSRKREIWGAVLIGVGALAFATDVGLQSACMLGSGPYFESKTTRDPNTSYYYGCRGWEGTGLMDFGGAALATGVSLLAWERSYQRDRNIYRRGSLRIVPTLGGLRALGRF